MAREARPILATEKHSGAKTYQTFGNEGFGARSAPLVAFRTPLFAENLENPWGIEGFRRAKRAGFFGVLTPYEGED